MVTKQKLSKLRASVSSDKYLLSFEVFKSRSAKNHVHFNILLNTEQNKQAKKCFRDP